MTNDERAIEWFENKYGRLSGANTLRVNYAVNAEMQKIRGQVEDLEILTLPELDNVCHKAWDPNHTFDFRNVDFNEVVRAATYSKLYTLQHEALFLKFTQNELAQIHSSITYIETVTNKLKEIGEETLIVNANKWKDITKTYSGRFHVAMATMRDILDSINPEIRKQKEK